ncbi:LOW QUALITY PROTEIN: hypothetical protein TorRG33x02_279700 [Trema orientale]|uniref:Uncharacterized protein n=1 Tax=Trema orientale TaxID=63057 RepID=A0A2P5CMN7_TREOI|nr:LOW QUALITY PROTEIN: hypothetical protein TorRG33x02_279700 [Trema orientale]
MEELSSTWPRPKRPRNLLSVQNILSSSLI